MDLIKRYTSKEGVRMSVAVTTDSIREAQERHDTWPVVTTALARTMTGALLLAGDFKNKETVSLRIQGNGPVGKVVADALGDNRIRGYVDHPHVDLPLTEQGKMDVRGAVGNVGEVQVTRFTGMDQNYTSTSPLVTGEIGDDLAYYLYTSEQVPSTISLGAIVNEDHSVEVAGGFLVQALPDATDEILEQVEYNIIALGGLSSYLKAHPSGEGLAEEILYGLDFHEVYEDKIAFGCTCSKERFLNVLTTLSEEEKQDLAAQEETELVCHYCNTKYHFTSEELKEAWREG